MARMFWDHSLNRNLPPAARFSEESRRALKPAVAAPASKPRLPEAGLRITEQWIMVNAAEFG